MLNFVMQFCSPLVPRGVPGRSQDALQLVHRRHPVELGFFHASSSSGDCSWPESWFVQKRCDPLHANDRVPGRPKSRKRGTAFRHASSSHLHFADRLVGFPPPIGSLQEKGHRFQSGDRRTMCTLFRIELLSFSLHDPNASDRVNLLRSLDEVGN